MNASEKMLGRTLPAQEVSIDVLCEKYAKGSENTIAAVQARVADALAQYESAELREAMAARFLWAQQQGFIPAGRINSAAGMGMKATLMNCFVQPVGDSVTGWHDGLPGIYTAVAEAAETMRRGGGVGYDFSAIRPCGSKVKGTHSRASGPVSYMEVFDASCKTVESAGARRGAQMGVLRIDHPDIERFIAAKHDGAFTNFNLSIAVTDSFMQALEDQQPFDLVHAAEPSDDQIAAGASQRADAKWVYRTLDAALLWQAVMQSTYDHAEPGVLFIDRINAENNLYYAEQLCATNPCGEQPLPPYGCCDLGSINLTRFVDAPFTAEAAIDFARLREVAAVGVRMLDLALDATEWPLPQQAEEGRTKRRVGLGFLGLGSALVMLGVAYDSDAGRAVASRIAEELRDAAYSASIDLAIEKGPFPLFDADAYLAGQFVGRLPTTLRARIAAHGIRNSHLLSIAPTGSITLAFADNASNGIEPAFSWVYFRKKRMADGGTRSYEVADHAWRLYRHLGHDVSDDAALPAQFVTALQMAARDHLGMMQAVQPFIDTAISKTVNVPADYPYAEFKDLYRDAWRAGLKGLATYRPNAGLASVLSVAPAASSPALPDEDPLRRRFDSRPSGELESVTCKVRYTTQEGPKAAYLTVSFIRAEGRLDGLPVVIERPFEFFMPANQRSDGQQWITSTMRLLSLAARAGSSVARALADMREVVWEKGPVRCGSFTRADGTEVPMYHDSEVAAIAFMLQRVLIRRGFLDQNGDQVPTVELARQLGGGAADMSHRAVPPAPAAQRPYVGRKCPDCGAHALHKVDGCSHCSECHYIGSCG
ncbi:ribonucleoside-diphosphate reductase, adenosylcobalamin-dependent [Massilia eurypsychrophila]|uniref:Vitamin B12-dependent ribonucleotide reductase n=1 Tax=Massilia eurypsychrophila TaxID=1485217 RepID=A0A2G8TCH7_9BURK|nr:adenosylcobalamin-dependent ribonucleoside-diphosphate reductase [Massilia eurypsychrophila]PIL43747.1 ribonucleoside-diphosphate reductase, adenosylcobalamin-dependent [Massilia eurypsychrophila]